MSTSVDRLLQPWTEQKAAAVDKQPKEGVVMLQPWTEYERGWGSRPDGGSAHLTTADFQAFYDEYRKDLPKEAPDEYSVPEGTPVFVRVSAELYNRVAESKNGVLVGLTEFNALVKGPDGT